VAIGGSSDRIVAAVWSALLRRSYNLVRSFDLQDAITHHVEGCGCPHHGTTPCACQYVVLLAYPPGRLPAPPRVLTIHANQQTAWVTLHTGRSVGTGETHVLMAALAEAAVGLEPEQRSDVSWPGFPTVVGNN